MRDPQLDEELRALDRPLERLCKELDFGFLRLEEFTPKLLQNRLTKGVASVAPVLRLLLHGATCRRSPRWRGARVDICARAPLALSPGATSSLLTHSPSSLPTTFRTS